MQRQLIINADDFGLTPGINRAVGELHRVKALPSATLMANGPAFDDALQVAHANPALGVGCHIVLTDGVPVADPRSIPTLLGGDGKTFRPFLIDFLQALQRGAIREQDIEREATAQVQKVQRAGIAITHLDTHKHTHLFSAVTRPLLRVAQSCSIRSIRNPFEPRWALRVGHGTVLRRLQVKLLNRLEARFQNQSQIRRSEVRTTGGTIGISATSRLDATSLSELLAAMPPQGIFELCCHPGYDDGDLDRVTTRLRVHRDIERIALLSQIPKLALHPNGLQLIHYGSLGSEGVGRKMSQTASYAGDT